MLYTATMRLIALHPEQVLVRASNFERRCHAVPAAVQILEVLNPQPSTLNPQPSTLSPQP